jgi:hypothetical protein
MVMKLSWSIVFLSLAAGALPGGSPASAHCDGLDGPVVTAAREALESGDVKRVLIWVRADDEAAIRAAFTDTTAVRALGTDAKALADRHFFETLVRVHRAGEGAQYTGLKPAGRDLGPAIPAADEAIATGSEEALLQLLVEKIEKGLRSNFKAVLARKAFAGDDVAAGREYVESYVAFIHYVERLYEAAEHPADGHYPEGSVK